MLDGTSIQPLVAGSPATRQMKWDDGPSLPDGSNDQPQSSSSVREVHRSPHTVGAGQAANRRNMLTWSSGGDLRRYEHEREAEDRVRGAKLKTRTKTRRQTEPAVLGGEELESRMETVLGSGSGLGLGLGFEPGLETRSDDDQLELEPELEAVQTVPTKGNKKARRQMQNRLAQRAFRARSKVQHQEVSWRSCLDTYTQRGIGRSSLVMAGRRPPQTSRYPVQNPIRPAQEARRTRGPSPAGEHSAQAGAVGSVGGGPVL